LTEILSGASHYAQSARISIRWVLFALYCFALLFAFDVIYSNFIYIERTSRAGPAVRNSEFDHALAPTFAGYDSFGPLTYPVYTNSLGFRDLSSRTVPLRSESHRVLLIGDSFTEGTGISFEQTFAGLLVRAGREKSPPIEVLDAAVRSYSPVLYYKKIKYLLESGLQFDELVVFSDISDVRDEASFYFCFDEDPTYRAYCGYRVAAPAATKKGFLEKNFVVSNSVRSAIKTAIHDWRHPLDADGRVRFTIGLNPYGRWTLPGFDGEMLPLGAEGGVARSVANMQKLATLVSRHKIPMTIVVYPWPHQLFYDDRNSRQVSLWQDFCRTNCKRFINVFPAFFAEKERHEDWYDLLFINKDVHFSAGGHALMFREIADPLLSSDSKREY
jgi:hypothetical protein